jgi:beta-lactamase class A
MVTGEGPPGADTGPARRPLHLATQTLSAEPPAVVSVWCGRPGEAPAFTRLPDREHYAASLVKLAIMLAAYRAHERGDLDLGETVLIRDEFSSVRAGTFRAFRDYDNDEEPWQRLGQPASLRWLCRRMIVASSNLAANTLLERVGMDAVAAASPPGMVVRRPIEDTAAAEAGITNTVTSAAAVELLTRIATGKAAGPVHCREMLALLRAQQYRDEIPAGLPPGTPVANKNGWTTSALHDAALVFPADAPPYALVVCTTELPEQQARALIHDMAAASWADRHDLGSPAGAAGDIGWRRHANR